MNWKEQNGVFTAQVLSNTREFTFVIVNCHVQPKHKFALGTNFYLALDKMPIGDFWSIETAKEAAINLSKFINENGL